MSRRILIGGVAYWILAILCVLQLLFWRRMGLVEGALLCHLSSLDAASLITSRRRIGVTQAWLVLWALNVIPLSVTIGALLMPVNADRFFVAISVLWSVLLVVGGFREIFSKTEPSSAKAR